MKVYRLASQDCQLGQHAVRLLKASDDSAVPSAEHMSRWLSRPENVFIVAQDGDVPIGYVIAYRLDRIDRSEPMMLLYEIELTESYRRLGIGRRLIGALKAECGKANAVKMWAPTDLSNVAAVGLFASTGAAPRASENEVTYVYSRDSFVGSME